MAEAQGLSRTILQAPDLIGEAKESESLAQQQAFRQAKINELNKPKLPKTTGMGLIKYGGQELETKIAEAYSDGLFNALKNGGNEAAIKYATNFALNYKPFATAVNESLKPIYEMSSEISPERFSELGAVNLLTDVTVDLKDNLQVTPEGYIVYKNEKNELVPANSHPAITQPRSYYSLPADWLNEGIDFLSEVVKRIENDGVTTTSAAKTPIQNQANRYMKLVVNQDPDLFADTAIKYFKTELGMPRVSKTVYDALLTDGEYTYTDNNGNMATITRQDILNWGARELTNDTLDRINFSKTEDSKGATFNFSDSKFVTGLKGRVFEETLPSAGINEKVPVLTYEPANIKFRTVGENLEEGGGSRKVRAELDNAAVTDDGIFVRYSYMTEKDTKARSEEKLLDPRSDEIAQIESAIGIPEGSFKEYYTAKVNASEPSSVRGRGVDIIESDGTDLSSWKTSNEYKVGENIYFYNKENKEWQSR